MLLSPPWSPPGRHQSQTLCYMVVCRSLVELLGHLATLSLLKIRLCNHLNKEQDTTFEAERVCEVSSFLLRAVDLGKMIS